MVQPKFSNVFIDFAVHNTGTTKCYLAAQEVKRECNNNLMDNKISNYMFI